MTEEPQDTGPPEEAEAPVPDIDTTALTIPSGCAVSTGACSAVVRVSEAMQAARDAEDVRAFRGETTLAELVNLKDSVSQYPAPVEASSSSLEILSSGAMPMSKAAYDTRRMAVERATWESNFSLGNVSIEETQGYRLRIVYRILVQIARIVGDMAGPTILQAALQSTPFRPSAFYHPSTPTKSGGVTYGGGLIQTLHAALEDIEGYTYTTNYSPLDLQPSGMTYLPPPIPDSAFGPVPPSAIRYARKAHTQNLDYRAENDTALAIWLKMAQETAKSLKVFDGTEEEPRSGVYGTVGLFDPHTARLLWPTQDEIFTYETVLHLEVYDRMCEESIHKAEQYVVEHFGYTREEAIMLCKSALYFGNSVYSDDFDTMKIRELKKLEIIGDRAQEAADPRAQLAVAKQMQLVEGLTANQEADTMESFRDLAAKGLDRADEDMLGS